MNKLTDEQRDLLLTISFFLGERTAVAHTRNDENSANRYLSMMSFILKITGKSEYNDSEKEKLDKIRKFYIENRTK